MPEILFVSVVSILCGYRDYKQMELFANAEIDWFRGHFSYAKGIPSHDTIERLFAHLNPKEFERALGRWIEHLRGEPFTHIAVDGKRACGSYDTFLGKKANHIVSAFSSELGICFGQETTEDKSNEITAIPKVLNMIDLSEKIITIDAMGCQTSIAQDIVHKGGDYILAVKDNQKNLAEEIESIFRVQKVDDIAIEQDCGHGRIETRTGELINNLTFLEGKENWKNLSCIVKVSATRYIKSTQKEESAERFYITSCQISAEKINKIIRNHWAIENNLHWCLDVVFKEDKQRKRKGNSSENMNILYKIILPLLKKNNQKISLKHKSNKAALSREYRNEILNF